MRNTNQTVLKEKTKLNKCVLRLLVIVTIFLFTVVATVAQQPQSTPGQRGATGDGFSKVDASSIVGNRRPGKSAQNKWYRTSRSFPKGSPPKGKTFLTVGVTIGRGKLASDAEIKDDQIAKVDGCVEWEDKKCKIRKSMVLARIPDNSTVSDKDQIQMSIEYLAYRDVSGKNPSNNVGYLYVISREQFPDGTFGDPVLIFPTLKTYQGDNSVFPGSTVVMPMPDRPWTISRSDSGRVHAFETYTIVVSPEPLKDLEGRQIRLDERSIVLNKKLVATWIRLWGGSDERGELENGAGQLVTRREVKSSGNPSAGKRGTDYSEDVLKQDDPLPQMIFRKVVNSAGKMLVSIKLPFKDTAIPASPNQ